MCGLGLGVRTEFYWVERANKLHALKHWHKLSRAVYSSFMLIFGLSTLSDSMVDYQAQAMGALGTNKTP